MSVNYHIFFSQLISFPIFIARSQFFLSCDVILLFVVTFGVKREPDQPIWEAFLEWNKKEKKKLRNTKKTLVSAAPKVQKLTGRHLNFFRSLQRESLCWEKLLNWINTSSCIAIFSVNGAQERLIKPTPYLFYKQTHMWQINLSQTFVGRTQAHNLKNWEFECH